MTPILVVAIHASTGHRDAGVATTWSISSNHPTLKRKKPEDSSSGFFVLFGIRSSSDLALAELELPAGAALAVLLTFFHAAVAGQEAALAEGDFQRVVELGQGAAQTHDDR